MNSDCKTSACFAYSSFSTGFGQHSKNTHLSKHNALMKVTYLAAIIILFFQDVGLAQYYPDKSWEQKEPEAFGIDAVALERAVAFAMENEYTGPKDLRQAILKGFEREPFHEIKGRRVLRDAAGFLGIGSCID